MTPPKPAPVGRETCRATFAIQGADADQGTFRGMASVFNTLIDAWIPTRILSGAFSKTLANDVQRKRVKVLYQHSEYEPIGVPTLMEENTDGLLVEAKISRTTRGNDTITLMRDGVITELSIGFEATEWSMKDEGGNAVRLIHELELWEFSPVTFGANRDARIMSVNSALASMPAEFLMAAKPLFQQLAMAEVWTKSDGGLLALDMPAALPVLTRLVSEGHVGKVLSAKNESLVSDAVAALQKLLDAAKAAKDEDESQRRVTVRPEIANKLRELDLLALEHRVLVPVQ